MQAFPFPRHMQVIQDPAALCTIDTHAPTAVSIPAAPSATDTCVPDAPTTASAPSAPSATNTTGVPDALTALSIPAAPSSADISIPTSPIRPDPTHTSGSNNREALDFHQLQAQQDPNTPAIGIPDSQPAAVPAPIDADIPTASFRPAPAQDVGSDTHNVDPIGRRATFTIRQFCGVLCQPY